MASCSMSLLSDTRLNKRRVEFDKTVQGSQHVNNVDPHCTTQKKNKKKEVG